MNKLHPFSLGLLLRLKTLVLTSLVFFLCTFGNAVIGQSCDTTFIRRIGDIGVSERAFKVSAAPGGNLLIGGSKGNVALIMMTTPEGEIVWERSFDFGAGDERVHEMLLDSEGKLLVIGRVFLNPNTYSFIMRYDYINNTILWSKRMANPANVSFESVVEVPNSINYMVVGSVHPSSAGLDNYVFGVNKNTGAISWNKVFNNGATDAFSDIVVKSGSCYTANVQRYGNIDQIRGAVSKLTFTGSEVWTKSYLRPKNVSARTYGASIDVTNDTLVVFGHGSLSSSNEVDYSLQLFTTKLDGTIVWAKNYKLPGSTNIGSTVIAVPDGYIVQGTFVRAFRTEIFVMKLNKQGSKVWAKSIGSPDNEYSRSMAYSGGYIYFTGYSDAFNGDDDILFGKMSPNGELWGPGCSYVEDILVTTTNLTSPFSEASPLNPLTTTYAVSNTSLASSAVTTTFIQDIPSCGCQIEQGCVNVLVNSSFENALAGWNTNGNVTTTADAHSGLASAKICGSSPGSIGQIFPAQAGESYTASLWAKTDNPPSNAYAQLRYLDASFAPIATGNDQQFFFSNTYDYYSLNSNAPLGTAYVHFMVWKEGIYCVTIDDLELCKQGGALPDSPDFTVIGLAPLATPIAQGNQVPVSFTLSNIGTAAYLGSYDVKIYASTATTLNQNSVLLSTLPQSGAPIGFTTNVVASPTLPPSLAPGNYYLVAIVDQGQTVQELNENNNSISTPITVIPGCGGNITLSSQAQVNAFTGCPIIGGNLTISGADIQNLTPLSVLQEVGGVLSITTNATLTSLNGLGNLNSIGGLNISNNPLLNNLTALASVQGDNLSTVNISQNDALTTLNGLQGITGTNFLYVGNKNQLNLDGLNGLTHVNGSVQLMSNKKLVSLSGLSALTQVTGDFLLLNAVKLTNLNGLQSLTTVNNSFNIQFDSSLVSLSGLENLQSVGALRISSNPKLLTLAALSSLTQAPILNVQGNALLSECCTIVPLLNGNVTIQTNLTGCNSAQEIVNQCSTGGGGGNSIDLSLTVTSPATAPIYTSYPTVITITNSGGIPATGVKVVCQKPNGVVYTGGNEFTASQGSFGPLTTQEWAVGTIAPGASATLTVNYFLLQATPPAVYAQVTAANEPDADSTPNNGTPPTPNEDDEASSAGTPPPPPTQPDLTLTDFIAPASTPPGTANFTFTLKNTGTANVQGSYQIGVFLSSDNVLSSNDYAFTTIAEQNTAIGSFSRSGSFTIPAAQAPGNYFLIMKADMGSVIAESNENNNTVVVALTITGTVIQLPDLQLGNLNAPSNLLPNSPTSIDFQLSNTGNAAVQGSYQTDIFLSTDNALSADDQLLLSMPEQNTAIGSANRTASVSVGNSVPVGNYYLLLKVDAGNAIAEGDENNNTQSRQVIVGMSCNNNYILSTQAEVDAFPACNFVNGNLRIDGDDIVDLMPLSGLTSITGLLEIQNNLSLTSLNGLDNLKTVGGLLMSNNPILTSLSPLSSLSGDALFPLIIESQSALANLHGLEGITGANYLRIQGNTNLQKLTGLDNLTIVRGEFLITQNPALLHLDQLAKLTTLQSTLILDDNPLLENLHGLSHLTSIGGTLFLNGTNKLTDLQGLQNLTSLYAVDIKDNEFLQNLDALSAIASLHSLRVRNNTVLSDCCGIYPVMSANGVSGAIEISGNPNGCNSQSDILANCAPQGVDLQLAMTATNPSPGIYTSFPVKLTITNAGGQAATGVEVAFPRPAGVVYEGGNEFTASKGAFNAFGNERWYIGNLAAGESATITVSYFLLTSNALHPYAQVFACNEHDSDSSPNNGTSPTPNEDDEATVGINSFAGNNGGASLKLSDNRQRLNFDRIYPNPAQYIVTFDLHSQFDQAATMEFYNQQGQLVQTMDVHLDEGQNIFDVMVSDWKSGAYNIIAKGEKMGLPAYSRFLKIWEE